MERNETGLGVIPAGVAANGTVTSESNNSNILIRSGYTAWVSGGGYASGELAVSDGQVWNNTTATNTTVKPATDKANWEKYNPKRKSSTWIYIPANGGGLQKIAKLERTAPVLDVTAETYYEILYMDRAIVTVGAVAFEFVTGNLRSYYIDNNGGADGTLNGVVFKTDEILNRGEELTKFGHRYQNVAFFNGTGTNLYIVEN